MINLLDKNTKKQFKAARRNVIWLRYNFIVLAVIIGLNIGLVALFSFTFFDQIAAKTSLDNAKSQGLKDEQKIKEKADKFRGDLEAAKTLLDANVSYSDIIITLANAVPPNCTVKNMSITASVYKDSTKDIEFYCKKNNRETYDIVSQLITDLERSLVYHKVYVQQAETPSDDPTALRVATSVSIQDPSTKIPLAIPKDCKLQSINTLNHGSVGPYIALECRPTANSQNAKVDRRALDESVLETLKKSCYFTNLQKTSSKFQSFEQNYYIAHYMYSFSDISFKSTPETGSNGEVTCQKKS